MAKVLIVGAGAAGLMAAGAAVRQGHQVTVLEHTEKPGQKILVTGKGRCNVTNDCDRETLLVLDATTGQNAISQAKNFGEIVPLTGVVLTKLDGTAKGGVVLSVHEELHVPIKWIGLGEREDDLDRFNPEEFAKALFETDDHVLQESTKV